MQEGVIALTTLRLTCGIMKMETLMARLIFGHNHDVMEDVPLMVVCVLAVVLKFERLSIKI